jgi:hypothetical protein
MKILIACEYSGTVRDAFTALGHDAMSCDLLPSEKPGKHYHGDVLWVELPFGGTGLSGHGREKGLEALYAFTTLKTVAAHHG